MEVDNAKRTYLMISGTLFPAFVITAINMAANKRGKVTMTDLLLFAGASVLGGYYTSKLLK